MATTAKQPTPAADGFKRMQAHQFGDAYNITPRRRHIGPPPGMADRRQIMYSGRTDHLHKAEWPAQAQAPKAAPTLPPRPSAAPTQAAPELPNDGALLARIVVRALAAALGPYLARALDDSPQAHALAAALAQAPAAQAPAQAAPPAQARTRRTRKAPAQAPAQEPPAQAARDIGRPPAARPAPELAAPALAQAADLEKRKADRRRPPLEKLTPQERRELREYFANLDLIMAKNEMYDNPTRDMFDFETHSDEYINAFLYMLTKQATAREAHNVASRHAYGEDAKIV